MILIAISLFMIVMTWGVAFMYLDRFRKYHDDDSRSAYRVWCAMGLGLTSCSFLLFGAALRFYSENPNAENLADRENKIHEDL